MEDRLNHLNRIIDNEMSRTPVFTEKDEKHILAALKNTSSTRFLKKKNKFVPRLLTAALFAGVIFTSYTLIEDYLTPDTVTKFKEPEVRYAEAFTQASSKLSFNEETGVLTIEGTVKNATPFNSEPFQAQVHILNEDLAEAVGSVRLSIDVPKRGILKPDEPFSFIKVVTLEKAIDKSALREAIQIEIFSETKTLTSFVIHDMDYRAVVVKESPAADQPKQETQENSASETTKEPSVQEENHTETSLVDLEEKYGKKKSPFEKVDIVRKSGTFYFNGVTVGMKFEEINHILGPYDKHSMSNDDLSGHNIARWKIKDSDDLYVHYAGEPGTNYTSRMFMAYLNEDEVNELKTRLGEPYYVNKNGYTFYYLEESQQLLYINSGELVQPKPFEGYQVVLRFEDTPNLLKNVPPKE
jgi:hypothetical protein